MQDCNQKIVGLRPEVIEHFEKLSTIFHFLSITCDAIASGSENGARLRLRQLREFVAKKYPVDADHYARDFEQHASDFWIVAQGIEGKEYQDTCEQIAFVLRCIATSLRGEDGSTEAVIEAIRLGNLPDDEYFAMQAGSLD